MNTARGSMIEALCTMSVMRHCDEHYRKHCDRGIAMSTTGGTVIEAL